MPEGLTSIRPWRTIVRRKSRQIMVGNVPIGGDAPISVQSMTNTLTSDAKATIGQITELAEAGADLVRVSCPDTASTGAFAEIVRNSPVSLIADIHFHYQRAIEAAKAGAACLRINPGNIGKPERIAEVIQAAKDHNCAIRIGVNGGSLERDLLDKYREPCPEAMVESALRHVEILEAHDFTQYKISVKASDPFLTIAAYQQLAEAVDCPLHLGVTEAGGRRIGTVKSTFGLSALLWAGIGDTIRVSLSTDPVEEVMVGFDILKSLGLRSRGVNIIACPSCARQGFDVIKTVEALEQRLAHISAPISLSIIGCVVNGPGEAAFTDYGFTGGGAGAGMLYVSGQQLAKENNEQMIDRLVGMIEQRAAEMIDETDAK
ncbi:MAG: 4-hydroxy-3-methylbut-2-en-1-yl diphosphate synthase [Robiginitomaculum sp.]|nr:MAG: 4-hydroxy-3-methylbut-2-en-1-yl diphosphate synthase [Robiginitomaculum sp.]